MTTITLPYPPSANRYYRNFRGRMVRSQEAEAYRIGVGWQCNLAGIVPLHGDLRVSLDFYRPAKRGDLDNLLKVVFDSLNGYAYGDDQQIVEIHAMRHDDKADPRVEVVIGQVGA